MIASPLIVLILIAKPRCRRGVLQRLGLLPAHLRNLESPVIWVHAVSLGEVVAVDPLVKALSKQYPHCSLVVSTVTETGREAVEQRLAGFATHCYFPLDFPWAVRAYVRCLQPSLLLVVETEIWPNLFKALSRLRTPIILVNGRLSSNSFKRYRYIRGFMKHVLSSVTMFLMQSERDAQRIIELGANPEIVSCSGNMKFDQVSDETVVDTTMVSRAIIDLADDEELLVAGSTHSDEEDQLLRCYKRLREKISNLVLLIAPRHIERVQKVEEKIRNYGLSCSRKSQLQLSQDINKHRERGCVIILDTRGELASMYALGWLAFVGGTLTPVGGHNLLEPARWGIPVLFGPYTDHCAEVATLLCDAGGGIAVKNEQELYERIMQAYHDRSWTQQAGQAAKKVLLSHRGAVEKNFERICSVLESGKPNPVGTSTCRTSIASP